MHYALKNTDYTEGKLTSDKWNKTPSFVIFGYIMKCLCNIVSMHDPIDHSEYWILARKCNGIRAIWIHMIWITAKNIIHHKNEFSKTGCRTGSKYLLTNIDSYFHYHNSIWYLDACYHHFARVFEKLKKTDFWNFENFF